MELRALHTAEGDYLYVHLKTARGKEQLPALLQHLRSLGVPLRIGEGLPSGRQALTAGPMSADDMAFICRQWADCF